jgi:hypothetical protein
MHSMGLASIAAFTSKKQGRSSAPLFLFSLSLRQNRKANPVDTSGKNRA